MIYTGNDYSELEKRISELDKSGFFKKVEWQKALPLSVIVNVYNQTSQLRKQLLALKNQTYHNKSIELIIADDGGNKGTGSGIELFEQSNLPFNSKYIWIPPRHSFNPEKGKITKEFGLARARNEAMKIASNNPLIFLDADMIPEHEYVEKVMKWHYVAREKGVKILTIQDRGHVNPEEMTDLIISGKNMSNIIRRTSTRHGSHNDWRLPHYDKTNRLKIINHNDPFIFIGSLGSGGNCSFLRNSAFEIGLYDESFTSWGGEDTEFSRRMFEYYNLKLNEKLFFIPVPAIAYHLEHGESVNTERKNKIQQLITQKHNNFRRKSITKRPEVSVYVPCYNQERFIEKAIESIASQNYDLSKLEVIIGEDASKDSTVEKINSAKKKYPKLNIKIISDGKNYGLSQNTNRTISACRGEYIIQLDPDDELMPNTINRLVEILKKNPKASMVTGEYLSIDNTTGQKKSYTNPIFTQSWYEGKEDKFWYVDKSIVVSNPKKAVRQILEKRMCLPHPRMFRRSAFFATEGADPALASAVDYDLYSKICEVGLPLHITEQLYIYNANHGGNVTKGFALQSANALCVIKNIQKRNNEIRKEIYLLDDIKNRATHLDLNSILLRTDILIDYWKAKDKTITSSLYKTITSELENIVAFSRWSNSEFSRQQLDRLIQFNPNSEIGRYYQATFFYGKKKYAEALKVLSNLNSSDAITLEQKISKESGIKVKDRTQKTNISIPNVITHPEIKINYGGLHSDSSKRIIRPVSVYITSYNCARYITESIDSVIEQSFFKNGNTELIVVVDNDPISEKETLQKLNRYSKLMNSGQMFLIVNGKNLKAGGASNVGVNNSLGKYVLRFDSDDKLIDPFAVEKLANFFERDKENKYVLVCGDLLLMDHNSNLLNRKIQALKLSPNLAKALGNVSNYVVGITQNGYALGAEMGITGSLSTKVFKEGIDYFPTKEFHSELFKIGQNPILHPTLVRKDALNAVRTIDGKIGSPYSKDGLVFREDLPALVDISLWHKLSCYAKKTGKQFAYYTSEQSIIEKITGQKYIFEPMAAYRVHPNQISKLPNNIKSKIHSGLISDYLRYLGK